MTELIAGVIAGLGLGVAGYHYFRYFRRKIHYIDMDDTIVVSGIKTRVRGWTTSNRAREGFKVLIEGTSSIDDLKVDA